MDITCMSNAHIHTMHR